MTEDVFIKQHGNSINDDLLRVRMLEKVCTKVDGLITASLLWSDSVNNQAGYTRLTGLQTIMEKGPNMARQMAHIGTMLAKFHQVPAEVYLNGMDAAKRAYPLESFGLSKQDKSVLEKKLPIGMFHGDCWHGNWFKFTDGDIVVLDPLPNTWLFDPNYKSACGAIDLAMLHMSIFFSHSIARHLTTSVNRFLPVADALLDGYLSQVGSSQPQVRTALLHLSRIISCRYVAAYRHRLAQPVAAIKTLIGHKIVVLLDRQQVWKQL